MGLLHDSRKRIFITHHLSKSWIQVCSHTESLVRYFTKLGCGMSATGEYDHLIFPQNFSSGDFLSVYDAGKNNVVVLIHPTKDI